MDDKETLENVTQRAQNLERMAERNPDIRESDEYKNLIGKYKELSGKTKEEVPEQKEEVEVSEEEKPEEEKPEEEKVEDEKPEDPAESRPNTWGTGSKKKKQKFSLKSFDEVNKAIDQKYSIKDLNTFFDSTDKWRTDSQNLNKVQGDYNSLISEVEALPEAIRSSIDEFAKNPGSDSYKTAFNNATPQFDFTKSIDDQSVDDVINFYLPSEISKLKDDNKDEKIDDSEFKSEKKRIFGIASKFFEKDKKNFEGQRASILEKNEIRQKDFKGSITSSVDHLSKQFPSFDQQALSKVQSVLASGNIASLFINGSGNYNDKAALSIARVLYGDEIHQDQLDEAQKKAESKAAEDIVFHGDKEPKTKKGSLDQKAEDQKEGVKHLKNLRNHYSNDPYV